MPSPRDAADDDVGRLPEQSRTEHDEGDAGHGEHDDQDQQWRLLSRGSCPTAGPRRRSSRSARSACRRRRRGRSCRAVPRGRWWSRPLDRRDRRSGSCDRSFPELRRDDLGVRRAADHEFVVRAAADDPAVVDDEDLVGVDGSWTRAGRRRARRRRGCVVRERPATGRRWRGRARRTSRRTRRSPAAPRAPGRSTTAAVDRRTRCTALCDLALEPVGHRLARTRMPARSPAPPRVRRRLRRVGRTAGSRRPCPRTGTPSAARTRSDPRAGRGRARGRRPRRRAPRPRKRRTAAPRGSRASSCRRRCSR